MRRFNQSCVHTGRRLLSNKVFQSSTRAPFSQSVLKVTTSEGSTKLRQSQLIPPTSSSVLSKTQCKSYSIAVLKSEAWKTAYVAIGSNLGNRVEWIEKALHELKNRGVLIKRTSSLWETEPMYVTDQDTFLNGVIEVQTTLKPLDLLQTLQDVENFLERKKIIDKGPRNIDLDILLYEQTVLETPRLIIPHALMLEREFVLRPLAELLTNAPGFYPNKAGSARSFLDALPASSSPMYSLSVLNSQTPYATISPLNPKRLTHVMGILNLTPDSFSDGGKYGSSYNDPSLRTETTAVEVNDGEQVQQTELYDFAEAFDSQHDTLPIIDVGGQSTAPGAPEVSSEEELTRVRSTIKYIKDNFNNHLISIDTYRASVAQAAISEGAHIINDVSAGKLDPEMLATVAASGKSVILMHMRGTPATMNKLTSYPDGLIPTIASELIERVKAAEEAGIYRWRIILDPGIGFAKTADQNLEILQKLDELKNWPGLEGFPWLVGSSRKGFIGKVTGVKNSSERLLGSMVAVTAAVQGGADIVRVHDVKETVEVVKMGDAIWRGSTA